VRARGGGGGTSGGASSAAAPITAPPLLLRFADCGGRSAGLREQADLVKDDAPIMPRRLPREQTRWQDKDD